MISLFIPSPSQGVWHLGAIPIRAYAIAIILGVAAAVWLGNRRWVNRGGEPGQVADIALWAVPAGIVGARLYHVATDNNLYFGAGKNPWAALAVWNGGLGIWGGVIGGFAAAALYCRRHGLPTLPLADALAPGLLLAQAIGRFGNYFNQELFGRPTTLPWGLKIDPTNRPSGYEQYASFHPTFLYESIWNLAALGVLLALERRLRLGQGRVFALYAILYTLGRAWIENLRIDPVELRNVGGLRFNVWTSLVVLAAAATFLIWKTWKIRSTSAPETSPTNADPAETPKTTTRNGASAAPSARGSADRDNT